MSMIMFSLIMVDYQYHTSYMRHLIHASKELRASWCQDLIINLVMSEHKMTFFTPFTLFVAPRISCQPQLYLLGLNWVGLGWGWVLGVWRLGFDKSLNVVCYSIFKSVNQINVSASSFLIFSKKINGKVMVQLNVVLVSVMTCGFSCTVFS